MHACSIFFLCYLKSVAFYVTFSSALFIVSYPSIIITITCIRIRKSAHYSLFYPFPNKPLIIRVYGTSHLKTVRKGEIARNESVFYLFREVSSMFLKFEIVFCNFFKFGRV